MLSLCLLLLFVWNYIWQCVEIRLLRGSFVLLLVFLFLFNLLLFLLFIFHLSSKKLTLVLLYPVEYALINIHTPTPTHIAIDITIVTKPIKPKKAALFRLKHRREWLMLLNWRQTDIEIDSTAKNVCLSMRECTHTKLWFFHVQLEVQLYLVCLVHLLLR